MSSKRALKQAQKQAYAKHRSNITNNRFTKKKNLNEAFMKIKKLSGKKHKIISAVSVCKNNKQIWSHHQTSIATFTDNQSEGWIDPFLFHSALKSKATELGAEFIKGDVKNISEIKAKKTRNQN